MPCLSRRSISADDGDAMLLLLRRWRYAIWYRGDDGGRTGRSGTKSRDSSEKSVAARAPILRRRGPPEAATLGTTATVGGEEEEERPR